MTGLPAIDTAFDSSGAAAWGALSFERLRPYLSCAALAEAQSLCPGPATVFVAAFPYFSGLRPGNLSLYARGEDYHRVLLRRLTQAGALLQRAYPHAQFTAGADSSPLPEKQAAWLAGLGLQGRNTLLILPPYGTYVFLGTILTDLCLPLPETRLAPDCIQCGKCLAACPSGALTGQGLNVNRCLSHLTQKKGTLDRQEQALVAAHPLIWGCDLCQLACPYNHGAEQTRLPEFLSDPVDSLTGEQLEGLTNRSFRERFGSRAFSWRGPAVLRRNLNLKIE